MSSLGSPRLDAQWYGDVISGPPSQLASVKTASVGTLNRARPPMAVTVPSAPDIPETSKMLEEAESVSGYLPPTKSLPL